MKKIECGFGVSLDFDEGRAVLNNTESEGVEVKRWKF